MSIVGHGEILLYLEIVKGWQQERHPDVQNPPWQNSVQPMQALKSKY